MKKIINTLFYGDRKTKFFLWSIIILLLASFACCILFMVTIKFLWIIGTIICLIAAGLVGRSVNLTTVTEEDANSNNGVDVSEKPLLKEENQKQNEETDDTYLKEIDKKQMKRLFVKYKVKREHRPILIDECLSKKIFHCPAYLWVSWNKVHFLVLEQKPREFSIDLSEAVSIGYERAVPANPEKDYTGIRKAHLISHVFEGLIPACYDVTVDRRRSSRKNLFIIGEDIKVTNYSARAVFDIIKASFDLPDRYNLPEKFGSYTREAYKTKILWQDGVLKSDEYKTRIKDLLQQMSEAKISDNEFYRNLDQMVDKQLITKEYAEYYSENRS